MNDNMPDQSRAARVLAGLVLGTALVGLAASGVMDRGAETQYESMLKRALVTFALARTLNGVISVIQETEIALQPAGVGVEFSPGQILDPVNDLVERFSWVMLAASASLAVQRLLLEISGWAGMTMILAAVVIFWAVCLIRPRGSYWRIAGTRMLAVAVILRFAVPVVVLATDTVYQVFLDPAYQSASGQVDTTRADLTRLHQREVAEASGEAPSGSLGLSRWFSETSERFRIRERLESYQSLFTDIAENLVELIAVFVIQTLLLPLLFLWGMVKVARRLATWPGSL